MVRCVRYAVVSKTLEVYEPDSTVHLAVELVPQLLHTGRIVRIVNRLSLDKAYDGFKIVGRRGKLDPVALRSVGLRTVNGIAVELAGVCNAGVVKVVGVYNHDA